jgi:hypothetical protein
MPDAPRQQQCIEGIHQHQRDDEAPRECRDDMQI